MRIISLAMLMFVLMFVSGCTCAGNGKYLSDVANDGSQECCSGLEPLPSTYVDTSTGECEFGAESPTCTNTKCGDGICELPENKCNCEIDCE